MRINNFQIKDKEYKNLDIDLQNNSSGVIAFIGNNGSGKSNLLESLSIIFHYLYNKKEKDIPFNFSITYTNSGSTNPIRITKVKTTVISEIKDKKISDPYDYLPKQLVAIYSGEEDRLWKKWYQPIYLDYINNITSGKISGIGAYNELPKMLYINKFYWHISLLCLLLQKFYNVDDHFCFDILNINEVHSVKFKFNKENYKNYPESVVKAFVELIDIKEEYTLDELKNIIDENGFVVSDIYKFLYIAFTPDKKKIIQDITIKYNDENLEIEDFSEGEKKMLLIKGALEFAGAEDSLFILDEPDAHIHLNNKIQIKKVFEKYADNRQVVITTHSPTLTDTLDEDSLFMLNSGKLVPQKKQEILENVSGEFWNKFQQNAFIASRKQIILLVEGKHDKEHITNALNILKDDYKTLDFDIFKLNTESNITPFLRGLYESDFDSGKIYIGLFDREKKIENDLKNPKNFEQIEGRVYKKLAKSDKENNSYFVATLPQLEDKRCDCSIETMYEYDKWESAYQKAVANTFGKTLNKSIKEYSEDVLNDAKNILANDSKEFNIEDFKNYRMLFDLLIEIRHYSEESQKETRSISEKFESLKKKKEPIQGKTDSFVKIFTKRRGTEVSAEYYNDQKVIIKSGSKLSKSVVDSYNAIGRNEELDKIAEDKSSHWILKSDKEVSSVSGAINYSTGGNMNGWDDWIIESSEKPLSTIRDSHNGIKIEFQKSVYNELLKHLDKNWKVEIGVKANLANAQIWVKSPESEKLWFGLETFSGKGNFANSLIAGIYSVNGSVKRSALENAINEKLSNSKGYWLEYLEIKDNGNHLDLNSIDQVNRIGIDKEYRTNLTELIVHDFIKFHNKRKNTILELSKF